MTTTAKKIIDWHGQGGEDLAREFDELPAGRYVLIAANALDEDDEERTLTQEAQTKAWREWVERGPQGPLDLEDDGAEDR